MWDVRYGNGTGTNDDSFREWWTITNGKKSFDCKNEDDANWLCEQLNLMAVLTKQPDESLVQTSTEETTLVNSFQARVWAREFCKRFPQSDENLILTWFANAIMAGYDEGVRDSSSYEPLELRSEL